jgi:hypothetical protein
MRRWSDNDVVVAQLVDGFLRIYDYNTISLKGLERAANYKKSIFETFNIGLLVSDVVNVIWIYFFDSDLFA